MTFLAPLYLLGAFVIAAAIVGLHFIVIRPPRSAVLPTARFVPETRATTVASASSPSDLLLMALRVLTVLAAGAALAKPILEPGRRATGAVILLDVSRSVRDTAELRDRVRALYHDGDAVVLFDSATHMIGGRVRDSLAGITPTSKGGNLSGALIAALRAGSAMRESADSLQLLIVSPLAAEELDAATDSIRRLWNGRARVIQLATVPSDSQPVVGQLNIDAEAEDPLAITADRVRATSATTATIYRRDATSRVGSSDEIAVTWPTNSRPPLALPRDVVDTVGGVTGAGGEVIAPFERRWLYPVDSIRGATVIARWVDGEPAAIERDNGGSCARSVAIPVTSIGDLVIRDDFGRLVSALVGPCATHAAISVADPQRIARLAGSGALAPRSAFQPRADSRSRLAPWLFAIALLASVAEVLLRRRRASEAVTASSASTGAARAA